MDFLKQDTRFDFLKFRQIALTGSAVVLLIGIASLFLRGLNFGIDFTGGTLVELSYQESVDVNQVRETLNDAGLDDAIVQYFGTSRDIMVRLPADVEGSSAQLSDKITSALRLAQSEHLTESTQAGLQQCIPGRIKRAGGLPCADASGGICRSTGGR